MTRKERYKEALDRLEGKRGELLRSGDYVKAASLHKEIEDIKKKIADAEAYEASCKAQPIRDLLTDEQLHSIGIIPLMIECHLIADFLTAVAYEVIDICAANGLEGVTFNTDLRNVLKASECFASFLTTLTPELKELLLRNDTLNLALHKKITSYINQRLETLKTD